MKSRPRNLYRALSGAILLGTALSSYAIPAYKESFKVEQPDGSVLTLRLVGDARAHLYLTEDGCPVVYDSELGYVHAELTPDGRQISTRFMAHDVALRGAAERKVARVATETEVAKAVADRGYGLCGSTFPSKGKVRALVLLVEFKDVKFGSYNSSEYAYSAYSDAEDPVHAYWDDLLNKEGFSGFDGEGSCRDWFMSNSADADGVAQFEPQFDLFGPVTLPNKVSYYGRNGNSGADEAPQKMVVDACLLLDDQIDFSLYDTDGDGKVDNVFIFYAGLGENDGGGADTVWPHSWDLFRTGSELELDGVTVDHYACSKETLHHTRMPDGIGTFIHEFSHVLGLPDLYTTSYNYAYTPGDFSVLDSGPYNNNSRTPPNYSSFERWALGWLKPDELTATGDFSLDHLQDSRQAYIVPTEKETEYYLVENRQHSGWDAYIPGHGMLIWHVDYVREVFEAATVNNDPRHQYVDLVEANNRKSEKYAPGHPFPGTDNVNFYDFRSWNNEDCKVSFRNIAEDSDGTVTFFADLNGSGVTQITAPVEDAEAEYYDLTGRRIMRPEHGQLVIRKSAEGVVKMILK